MSRRKWAAGAAVLALLGVGGYEVADVYDVVPGPLTLQQSNTPRSAAIDGHTYSPVTKSVAAPALPAVASGAAPSPAAVKASVDAALKDHGFGSPTAVTVLDGDTGTTLYAKGASQPTTPASVTKLLTTFAIVHSKLTPSSGLSTRAVLSGSTLNLVAGGDTVLATGHGDPGKIVGRAGLQDLADQVATRLKAAKQTHVTVNGNSSAAPGPLTAPGWSASMLNGGFTERITTLGLAQDRADDKTPAVADPAQNATQAFVAALKNAGIQASYGKQTTTPVTGQTLGSVTSAPVLDLLGIALQDSDNAMVESLARTAAAADAVHGDSGTVASWVETIAKAQGVNLAGVHLVDVCGLSPGTTLPVRVLGDILARAADGQDESYQRVISRLPVSGWNGTLHDRFGAQGTTDARGVVTAKTGSLSSVASLAGTLVTRGAHRLVFAVTTNGTFPDGPSGAKAAIDKLVSGLVALR